MNHQRELEYLVDNIDGKIQLLEDSDVIHKWNICNEEKFEKSWKREKRYWQN